MLIALAQLFFLLSGAVDDFRQAEYGQITPAQQQSLKDEATALDAAGQRFTAMAYQRCLEASR